MRARQHAPGSRITKTWWRPAWLLAWLLLLCSSAWAQTPAGDFDHLRTGFPLGGAHVDARCESCHVGGVFKGTPRECDACHVSGARLAKSNVVKGAGHIPTTLACEACHQKPAPAGKAAAPLDRQCAACHRRDDVHDGAFGARCEQCHEVSRWKKVSNRQRSSALPAAPAARARQATGAA